MKANYKLRIFVFYILAVLFSPQKVWAIDQLSEENIKKFYDRLESLESGNEIESFINFLEKHLHESFVLTLNFPFPDADGKTAETYNKKEMIESGIKNYKKEKNKTAYYTSILLHEDKKSAQVKNISRVPKDNQDILETSVLCVDTIILNEYEIIQITDTLCSITFSHKIDQLYE